MYLFSTKAPVAETGHASWQTGTPETKSTTFGLQEWQCKCGKIVDIIQILDPWHAITSSL